MPPSPSSGLSASFDTEPTGSAEVPTACGSVAGKPPTARQLRDRDRNGRKRARRSASLPCRRLTQADLVQLRRSGEPTPEHFRPRTRGECCDVPRPCPFVSCKWNLYLDVRDTGTITLNFPDLEPDELDESCALDVADRGGTTLDRCGEILNVTRERIRQVENLALARVEPLLERLR